LARQSEQKVLTGHTGVEDGDGCPGLFVNAFYGAKRDDIVYVTNTPQQSDLVGAMPRNSRQYSVQ
jgi:hypothetical protein